MYSIGIKSEARDSEKQAFKNLHKENISIMNIKGQALVVPEDESMEAVQKVVKEILNDYSNDKSKSKKKGTSKVLLNTYKRYLEGTDEEVIMYDLISSVKDLTPVIESIGKCQTLILSGPTYI